MPVTTNAVAAPDADLADSLVVAVAYDGAAFLNVSRQTPAQLSENVKAELAGRPDRRVYLKADARTPYSAVLAVLYALRTAGVNAAILLASQPTSSTASYAPPMGLEALLSPPPETAQSVTLRAGNSRASEAELKQQAVGGRPVALRADAATPFGDVVHAVDVYHGAGADVFLAALAQ
jgi:biopolymer transport protein ExbD